MSTAETASGHSGKLMDAKFGVCEPRGQQLIRRALPADWCEQRTELPPACGCCAAPDTWFAKSGLASDRPNHRLRVGASLAGIGVKVKLDRPDRAVLAKRRDARDFDLGDEAWQADLDPDARQQRPILPGRRQPPRGGADA